MKNITLVIALVLLVSFRSQGQQFVRAIQADKCKIIYVFAVSPQQATVESVSLQQDQTLLDKIQQETEEIILSKLSPILEIAAKIKMKLEKQKAATVQNESSELSPGIY